MTFDSEISVLSTTIGAPSDEAIAEGAPPHLELGIIAGLALPVPNSQTGQPLVIPIGRLRFNFPREQAIEVFSTALRAAEGLPEEFRPSGKVMVAQSMSDVENAAQNIKRATGR